MSAPLLLPQDFIPKPKPEGEWTPSRYLADPEPPPVDQDKLRELELAAQRQLLDGKALKKTRPRRTVDYGGGIGRYALLRKLRPSPRYVPYLRPGASYIIDLLPPKAYPENASTSLCTKFVHTSTNKIRCPVNCVTWTPEGRRVLTGSTSGEFTLWNGLTFNFETILQAHDTAVRAFEFNHAGTYLASADQQGVIKYFQPNMNNLTAWQGHRETIRGLSFCPDDGKFATCSDDATIRIWSFVESREERVLTGHGWDVKCVEWHPTKGLLASGSKDNLIKFWDPRTSTVLANIHDHKNTVQALAWSPSGDQIASASRDQTVRVFDIRAMKEYALLKGHKKEACSVTWHPQHPLLVSGGSEGAILHWDLSSPPADSLLHSVSPRASLNQAHDMNVWSLAFHPLGHILVSASNDHTTRFWSRERPGDPTSNFSAGGSKPQEDADAQQEDYGEGDDGAVPGFSGALPGLSWGDQQQQGAPSGASGPPPPSGLGDFIPGFAGDGGFNGTGHPPPPPPRSMPMLMQPIAPEQSARAPLPPPRMNGGGREVDEFGRERRDDDAPDDREQREWGRGGGGGPSGQREWGGSGRGQDRWGGGGGGRGGGRYGRY
ncbi:WD40 repeat-like protein [Exidia glandulosa HHB12029]|uniref:Polyadenylation factor subunit 2 n=1 Tax=Exidia glandulosa HHB12029 TaxID=1314781 RepID=A0A165FI60_EXIGL|nr:WD40 repeat-like protein [Exidia glandulosa HHB12029]